MIKITSIETSIAHLELKDDLLYVIFKEGTDMKLEHVDELIAARKRIQEGDKVLVMADVRGVWQVSKEAKAKAADEEFLKLSYATAIIIGSLPSKILANFYIKFNKPKVPTRMFVSEAKALEWLRLYKDKA